MLNSNKKLYPIEEVKCFVQSPVKRNEENGPKENKLKMEDKQVSFI